MAKTLKILVLYGSLTGNTKTVAQQIHTKLQEGGLKADLKNVTSATVPELVEYDCLIVGSSTWDDGQLQYDFEAFYQELEANSPDLSGKKLAVFGCGDTAYEQFCRAVDILETKFQELGSQKIVDSLKINGFPQLEENVQAIDNWTQQLTQTIS